MMLELFKPHISEGSRVEYQMRSISLMFPKIRSVYNRPGGHVTRGLFTNMVYFQSQHGYVITSLIKCW